jgi:hypothetical protein
MKQTVLKHAAMAAGMAATTLCGVNASAQSADALLDKLVDKGILTTQEANELREEADAGFRKAYQVKSGMPDWVTALKINGDFRGRFETFYSQNDAFSERTRWRYRLRAGMVATLLDNFDAGFRLTSSEAVGTFGGDPISGNSTLQNNGSKKFVFLDLAYGRWTFINNKSLTGGLTIGKMENPFVFSDLMFDADYTPEGAGMNLVYNINDVHAIKALGGAFLLDELGADEQDPYMYGGQIRWDAKWSQRFSSTIGAALLLIQNEENLTSANVPNIQGGNTRDPVTTEPTANFNPIVVDAALTYAFDKFPFYSGAFPIKLFGEYINNVAVDERNEGFQGGITFGKSGKRNTWEVTYRYKYMGGDMWYEEMVDSDWGAFYQAPFPNSGLPAGYVAGTNLRGHVARIGYSPTDALTLTLSYYRARNINESPAGSNSDMTRIQMDATLKF